MRPAVRDVARLRWRGGARGAGGEAGRRRIPEETAVAIAYQGSTYAVMMATPGDLEDFAVGFSLTERIVADTAGIEALDIVEQDLGIELRMWLAAPDAAALADRRRHVAGPTGCGLCGIESLEEAMRSPPAVAQAMRLPPSAILAAVAALEAAQPVNHATHAVHAAGFWRPDRGLVAVREDVGRHNALDKLAGALARDGMSGAGGAVLLTSRVSIEMIQKAAAIAAPVVIAVSAPTALAVRTAEAAGITLVAVARGDGFEIFSRSDRIALEADAHVA
ncbi:MAG: formate dehydrogenase accessory sulfurtransferase FdhD [Alphaproteobacteria bacterium]|nr:formate dehydrogenase accessory sulfurtransferase FdhD [Alphaproteobacteria bacterium]